VEVVAYRILQEALTNVARHSGALAATVRLSADKSEIQGAVEDHGVGFDARELAPRTVSGLTGMRERAELVGGSVSIEATRGIGTHLKFTLPLDAGRSALPWPA
jgi:signal transduction histidine kinase